MVQNSANEGGDWVFCLEVVCTGQDHQVLVDFSTRTGAILSK